MTLQCTILNMIVAGLSKLIYMLITVYGYISQEYLILVNIFILDVKILREHTLVI